MIYLNRNSKYIEIPKYFITDSCKFDLKITNVINNSEIEFKDLKDVSNFHLMYRFNIDFSNFINGEYNFSLYDEYGDQISLGIIQFGDYTQSKIINNNIIKKIQYNNG